MRKNGHRCKDEAAAFTLIELLVVIGIIALLLGLLVPFLSGARKSALLATCQSNLRQVYQASVMYATDNRGYLPDRGALGGFFFRRAPGTTPADDPHALPERYGIAAVLDRYGLAGDSNVWVCGAQPDWMQELGNTYMFATPSSKIESTPLSQLGQTSWVWDNYLALPYTSGFRGSPGPGWLIPDEKRRPPHELGMFRSDKQGSNYLFTDGSVQFDNAR
ncbi:MAG: prepilin-type N-terminal cleavage/methylation domain-containing protein [Phycisphaeraceae bacterium]